MRKFVKNELCNIIKQLANVNETLLKSGAAISQEQAQGVLTDCQQSAVEIGNKIEECEGEGTESVRLLEEYCEKLYQLCMDWTIPNLREKELKNIRALLNKIKNSILYDLPDSKKEVVFLPYKASMWDSLESVWRAARDDEGCNAYVIPIPYYDRNADGTLKQEHYEADLYPDDVPITDYREFDFAAHMPDAIFIHNPYDGMNLVTTVHPFFYSDNLKKYTDCLVYIPYYATAGGMSEAQALCPAYVYADYIVIQAPKYRGYFDERIPDQKFLSFGSPKFDSVIHKCQKLPIAPDGWEEYMQGKRVYFYNTSINGMLADTGSFLQKMAYVFDTFEDRKEACLLWRPHPLLESTFLSMRKEYWEKYQELKNRFLEKGIGIFDTSPSIETAIAYSDAYVGDAGTSVTSLFGVVGKPLFVLDNRIHRLPKEDDWKGLIYYIPTNDHKDRYIVTYGNQLYYSPNDDFHYQFYCDLSEYSGGNYYTRAYAFGDKIYVFPGSAEHILVISENKRIRKLELPHECEQRGAFAGVLFYEQYAWILPNRYSSLIRFHMETEELDSISGIRDFNQGMVHGERVLCARGFHQGKLFFLSGTGSQVLIVDGRTMHTQVVETGLSEPYHTMIIEHMQDDVFWLLPFEGTKVVRWNYRTGEKREYDLCVEGLKSFYRRGEEECNSRYFCSAAFTEDNRAIFVPLWANHYVCLDLVSGKAEIWESPFGDEATEENAYCPVWSAGGFIRDAQDENSYRYWCAKDRKTYDVDLIAGTKKEVEIVFDKEELIAHAPGFSVESQWMQYGCMENVFHTLKDFLDDTLPGKAFDREKQLEEFSKINASVDGRCGERVYTFVRENI